MPDITTAAGQQTLGVQRRYVDRGDGTVAELVEADQQSWARAAGGQYFRATNPAFGTGIPQGIATGWAATTPILVMDNAAGASAPSIYRPPLRRRGPGPGLQPAAARCQYRGFGCVVMVQGDGGDGQVREATGEDVPKVDWYEALMGADG